MDIDLGYDPDSLCGPVDLRVVRRVESYRGHKLGESYLGHIAKWHGGIPKKSHFESADGTPFRIGRFLTWFDEQSLLEGPSQTSWEFPDRDIRIDWSVLTLIDEEGPTSRCLFYGERLLPFAALYSGEHHPDEMSLGRAGVDLLCFFFSEGFDRPRVVVWSANDAQNEFFRWDDSFDEAEDEDESPVRYEYFTLNVSDDLESFVSRLRAEP